MGTGKHRWIISPFRKQPQPQAEPETLSPLRSVSGTKPPPPPREFLCPISGSLMSDPVIVSTGHTFERACVTACKTIGFIPTLIDGSTPDFSVVIPNLALKTSILNWAKTHRSDPPGPVPIATAIKLVTSAMTSSSAESTRSRNRVDSEELTISRDRIDSDESTRSRDRVDSGESTMSRDRVDSDELTRSGDRVGRVDSDELTRVGDSAGAVLVHAESELTRSRGRVWSESGSGSFRGTPLMLTTRPSCYSSCSSSSEFEGGTWEEDGHVRRMRSAHVYEQEEGVVSLRKVTRSSVDSRLTLATTPLLSALKSLISSKYSDIQVNALAALVNLSLEKINKVKIVRAGFVPPLIDVLRGRFPEAQEHACGALFSLALDDGNKTAIGVLGALQPLIHMMMRSESERAKHDAALALYHLSLVQSNRSKLVKLGSVQLFLGLVKSGQMPGRALLILCNIGACTEGRAAMLDAGAVAFFVELLKSGRFDSESTQESCVAAICALSHGGGLRFRGLAKAAGAVEVLKEVAEKTNRERTRDKARRVLEMLKAKEEEEEEDVDWEKVLEFGFPSRTQIHPAGQSCRNSSEF